MYFSTKTLAEREEWLLAFRKGKQPVLTQSTHACTLIGVCTYSVVAGSNYYRMFFCHPPQQTHTHTHFILCVASRDNTSRMLTHYHKGIFGLTLKGRWGCCGSPQRATPGCSPVPVRERESFRREGGKKRERSGGNRGVCVYV